MKYELKITNGSEPLLRFFVRGVRLHLETCHEEIKKMDSLLFEFNLDTIMGCLINDNINHYEFLKVFADHYNLILEVENDSTVA
jgi:hypothetical protein